MVASSRSRSEMLVVDSVNSTTNASAAAITRITATTVLINWNELAKLSSSSRVLTTDRYVESCDNSSAKAGPSTPSASWTSTALGS